MGKAFQAFMSHGPGDSLPATIDAAVAAAAIAVDHVKKRAREKLGKPGGKRFSGPMQITLEDLQVSRADGGGAGGLFRPWGTCCGVEVCLACLSGAWTAWPSLPWVSLPVLDASFEKIGRALGGKSLLSSKNKRGAHGFAESLFGFSVPSPRSVPLSSFAAIGVKNRSIDDGWVNGWMNDL